MPAVPDIRFAAQQQKKYIVPVPCGKQALKGILGVLSEMFPQRLKISQIAVSTGSCPWKKVWDHRYKLSHRHC
jgi:hypothetical protein